MVNITDAREAIYQAFATAWGVTSTYTFDNEQFTPPAGLPWVRLAVRHLDSAQESLGAVGGRKFDRPGAVIMQIFTPLNAGVRTADPLAKAAREVFEGRTISNIRFRGVSVREIGPDKGWYQTNVEAPFNYSETR